MKEKEFSRLIFKPQKSLGQNFLISSFHLSKIVEVSKINNCSKVVEIGPGYGFLTNHILKVNPQSIVCIEKDFNLFSWLSSKADFQKENLNILFKDVLDVKWEELVNYPLNNQQKITVIGNLPYNIANQLISKLIKKQSLFKKLVFLVQKEVAQRWVANNNFYKNKYSALSIILNYFCRTELVFEVPSHFFKPQPPVDGAVVSFEFKKDLPNLLIEKFFSFVRNCFRFRRKTLLNNIKSFHGNQLSIKSSFGKLDLHEKTRPQDLSIENYIKLFKMI